MSAPQTTDRQWFVTAPADIKGTLTFLGGGFGLLSALLTFFGIKDGTLNDLVRAQPLGAILICSMIGLGVGISLIVPTLEYTNRLALWIPTVVLAVVSTINLTVLPYSGAREASGLFDKMSAWTVAEWGIFAAYVLVVGVALRFTLVNRRKWNAPGPIVALCVSMILVGAGLYGALTIITSRLSFSSVPTVSAVVDAKVLTGSVKTDVGRSDDEVVIFAVGIAPGSFDDEQKAVARETLLARKITAGDGSGVVDSSLTTPIDPDSWTKVRVYACRQQSLTESQAAAPSVAPAGGESAAKSVPPSGDVSASVSVTPSGGESAAESATPSGSESAATTAATATSPGDPAHSTDEGDTGTADATTAVDLIELTNAELTARDQCGWADVSGTRVPSRLPGGVTALATGDISPSTTAGDNSLIVKANVQAKSPERTQVCLVLQSRPPDSRAWTNVRSNTGAVSSLSAWDFQTSVRSDEWQSAAELRLGKIDGPCAHGVPEVPAQDLLAVYTRPTTPLATTPPGDG